MIKRLIKFTLIVFLIGISNVVMAQHQELYSKEYFINKSDTLQYRVMMPENFDESKQYPVVLFLHGAGERGNNNQSQLAHGSKLFASEENRKKFEAIVIFPQCPRDSFWVNANFNRNSKPKTIEFPLNIEPKNLWIWL